MGLLADEPEDDEPHDSSRRHRSGRGGPLGLRATSFPRLRARRDSGGRGRRRHRSGAHFARGPPRTAGTRPDRGPLLGREPAPQLLGPRTFAIGHFLLPRPSPDGRIHNRLSAPPRSGRHAVSRRDDARVRGGPHDRVGLPHPGPGGGASRRWPRPRPDGDGHRRRRRRLLEPPSRRRPDGAWSSTS